MPGSVGLTESQQPISKDIVITVLTNVTAPIKSEPFRAESAVCGNVYMEKHPYLTAALPCMEALVIILVGTLVTSISIQPYERKRQNDIRVH